MLIPAYYAIMSSLKEYMLWFDLIPFEKLSGVKVAFPIDTEVLIVSRITVQIEHFYSNQERQNLFSTSKRGIT